jgi:hyperosmotically inducible periplasmic protein
MTAMNTRSTSVMKSSRIGGIVAIALLIGAIGCSAKQPIVAREDGAITNDVRARLAADASSRPLNVGVDTKAGVVKLTGFVPTDDDRNSVERIARATEGVRSVDNNVIFGNKPAGTDTIVR